MDIFGPEWINHTEKLEKNCKKILTQEDTLVITGDHSWGRNSEECREDLEWIERLPGKKILLRGNHDMFWDKNKTAYLNEQYKGRLFFLQNNYYVYGEYALVGTKGYCYEGKDTVKHFLKIRDRETARLEKSFQAAKQDGYEKYIMFLHYPPTSIGEEDSPFTDMARAYGAEQVIYSHCHGKERYADSIRGEKDGIMYRLVSSDYLQFCPIRIL